jgi:hypothetical protein
MKSMHFAFVGMWIIFCGLIIYLTEVSRKEEYFKIDCMTVMGGWHPDIPKKFTELCLAAKSERNDR